MSALLVGGLVWLGCSLALLAGVAYVGRRPWPDLDPDDCRRAEWDAHCADALGIASPTPIFDQLTAESLAPDFQLWDAEMLR
jgi:hypothetical protein